MSAGSAVRRHALGALAVATIAVTLTGCGTSASGDVDVALRDQMSTPTSAPASGPTAKAGEAPNEAGSVAAPADPSSLPTLPPGDPGPDAPGTDDPNGDLGNERAHSKGPEDPARRSVPLTAVLDAETVAAVAGGSWTSAAALGDSCAAPRPGTAVASRSTQLVGQATGEATGNRIMETVSTHHGADAAVAAVHALEHRLTRCQARSAPDPRIGDASVQLTLTAADGTITVVTAAAVDGVSFVLSGSGPVTGADTWSALADVALGSTCVAAIDGCH